MRNLVSKAVAVLRNTLQSSIINEDSVSLGVQLGTVVFHKTRINSHLSFLRACFRRDVIPKGFRLKFNPSISS